MSERGYFRNNLPLFGLMLTPKTKSGVNKTLKAAFIRGYQPR